jgi:hypothetical protein
MSYQRGFREVTELHNKEKPKIKKHIELRYSNKTRNKVKPHNQNLTLHIWIANTPPPAIPLSKQPPTPLPSLSIRHHSIEFIYDTFAFFR